jgi:hypothetical protein
VITPERYQEKVAIRRAARTGESHADALAAVKTQVAVQAQAIIRRRMGKGMTEADARKNLPPLPQ